MLGSMFIIHRYSYLTYPAMHQLISSILYAISLILIHLLNLNKVTHLYKIKSYNLQSRKLRNKNNPQKAVKTKINPKLILKRIGHNNFIAKYVNLNVLTGPDTVISARYACLDTTITAFGLETVWDMQTIDNFIVFCSFRR